MPQTLRERYNNLKAAYIGLETELQDVIRNVTEIKRQLDEQTGIVSGKMEAIYESMEDVIAQAAQAGIPIEE